jgi:hypothetical protein
MVQKGAAACKDPAVRQHLNSGCHSVDTKGASDQGRASGEQAALHDKWRDSPAQCYTIRFAGTGESKV